MASQRFQWFVAWRYLMARPRKVSRAIVIVGAVLAFVAALCFLIPYVDLGRPGWLRQIQRLPLKAVAWGATGLLELVLLLGAVRYLFTFFSTVSIGGVAIGTMALVIVLSVMNGFETDLRDKILGSNAHILISREEGTFTGYLDLEAAIDDVPGVEAHTPYLVSEVVIAANNNYSNVIIKGIDPHTVGAVTDLEKNLEQRRSLERLWPLAPDGTILGPPRDAGPGDSVAVPDAGPGEIDEAPDDLEVGGGEPLDLSGGPPDAGPAVDPAPPDFGAAEADPLDLSSGPRGGAQAARPGDAGAPAGDAGTELPTWGAARPIALDDREFNQPRVRRPTSPRVAKLDGVLTGRELVKNLRLYVGQEVSIVSPLGQDTPLGPAPRTKPYRVAGTFFTGMYEYDVKFIYVDLHSLQEFLSLGDEVDGIEVRVADPDRTGPVMRAIAQRVGPGFRVQDWQELNRNLFSALKLEKIAMFLVLAIIVLVASFSIIGNLIMVVVEKAKEIALIKTLGASNAGVMRIFVVQGFFIGLAGTALGVVNGLLYCAMLKVYGFPLNPEVYYIDRLPVSVERWSVAAVVAAGILISVVATLYPAYMAGRLRPVEGLRYE